MCQDAYTGSPNISCSRIPLVFYGSSRWVLTAYTPRRPLHTPLISHLHQPSGHSRAACIESGSTWGDPRITRAMDRVRLIRSLTSFGPHHGRLVLWRTLAEVSQTFPEDTRGRCWYLRMFGLFVQSHLPSRLIMIRFAKPLLHPPATQPARLRGSSLLVSRDSALHPNAGGTYGKPVLCYPTRIEY